MSHSNDSLRHRFDLKGKSAERIVYELAEKSFLTDWCYANPRLPNGKELCDLLVVFDNIAIVWQIKDLKRREDGQYKQSEVEKNTRQVLGAKRQLFELKTPVQLTNPRRGSEKFDPDSISDIYLISVLMGQPPRRAKGIEHRSGSQIHIFSREFTSIVLAELDTIRDFVEYLKEKERVFSAECNLIVEGGEKNLLAEYLFRGKSLEQFNTGERSWLENGTWDNLVESTAYLKRTEANRQSYIWDHLIDRAHEGSNKYERVARELARPARFERRLLGRTFLERRNAANRAPEGAMLRHMMPGGDSTYVFLFADPPEGTGGSREPRRTMLSNMCFVARGMSEASDKVIGIATEKTLKREHSLDYHVLYLPEWTADAQSQMELLQRELGIFANPSKTWEEDDEFPGFEPIDFTW